VPPSEFSYEPERVDDDLFAIPLPLHDGSPVNVFAAIGDDGVWLVDGGIGSDLCQATLRQGIAALGYAWGDVRGLLITHGHNDHVGAADAVADNGGEVLASRVETTLGRSTAFDEDWLERNGLPPERTSHDRWRIPFSWPEPTRLLEDGDRLQWGRLNLEVVWCPGHTPGLVCLFEPDRRYLFTTDHVMRRAPAPVAMRHAEDGDPMKDYLASLQKLKQLDVAMVLPGHGRPFAGLQQRLASIETEIQRQLIDLLDELAGGAESAYELLSIRAELHRRPIATRYMVSLMLARLRYLEGLERLDVLDSDGVIRYARRA
jgi:glyoxylase-like metal-dependent hydrolase (beta-lactamase superfamily II)